MTTIAWAAKYTDGSYIFDSTLGRAEAEEWGYELLHSEFNRLEIVRVEIRELE